MNAFIHRDGNGFNTVLWENIKAKSRVKDIKQSKNFCKLASRFLTYSVGFRLSGQAEEI